MCENFPTVHGVDDTQKHHKSHLHTHTLTKTCLINASVKCKRRSSRAAKDEAAAAATA